VIAVCCVSVGVQLLLLTHLQNQAREEFYGIIDEY
jgi:hypothetical protein